MTEEEPIMQEIPEGMEGTDPMNIPAPMRVNMLINELLSMVDHMSNIRGLIDETMKELMESQLAGHVHEHGDDCCEDPDCENKEE
ncbi:MAG: hypothetical protein ACTSPB_24070 [Candidatus Thorarchaeota archaeon]